MVSCAAGCHGSGAFDQVGAQVLHLEPRYLVDKVAAAFPGVQLVHHIGVVGDVYIGFVAAVKNPPVVAADLAARGHLNDQQCVTIHCTGFRLQVKGRIDFLPVVDGSYEVFFHAVHRIRGNALNYFDKGVFLLAFLLGGLALVHGVRKDWGDGARLPVMLAFLLCGYYGAHLFIEVQARYRYFLMPVLFLLAGAGAQLVFAWWQGRKNSGAKTAETS